MKKSQQSSNKAQSQASKKEDNYEYKLEIVWRNVILMSYLHIGALIGCYYWFSFSCKWQSVVFGLWYGLGVSAFGVTCGTHRLWAHKAYKAKLPLRILLCFMQTTACQNSIYEWVRDHRVHHKFSETDGDPHNARRGFFFAHMGWLLCRKHPDVKEKGKRVDLSDLEEDPVVMFQKKWFVPLTIFACFFLPTWIPWYCWGEVGYHAWSLTLTRYVLSLHATWLVNSAAHLWGSKPYDKTINPSENLFVSLCASGEGWHNYHHVFPWDYKAAELGSYKANFSTAFIDFFAFIGQAYELKSVPEHVVNQRALRTGDGSHSHSSNNLDRNRNSLASHRAFTSEATSSWGWDDKETPAGDKAVTIIRYQKEE